MEYENNSLSGTAQARLGLIQTLREKGITDENVLQAINRVPRELFVPDAFQARAYDDSALPIECQQTISQPYTVAVMSQQLEAKEGMKVLEIGTGSGYQAAVLYFMGLRVFTIERHEKLLETARKRLNKLNCNVAMLAGDGSLGWSTYAPYDRIIVTAGAPEIPQSLLKQLAPNGRLVIPVGARESQRLQVVVRDGEENQYDVYDCGEFKFVPLIGRKAWKIDDKESQT